MWWTVNSNRSTAQCRPRIFFSLCSLQVQWSRYLCTFCFGVSVLIFAMIQDQALVASKSKHYLIETKENSTGHKQVVGSFKILKKSYFKISKVSFAESFHAALHLPLHLLSLHGRRVKTRFKNVPSQWQAPFLAIEHKYFESSFHSSTI